MKRNVSRKRKRMPIAKLPARRRKKKIESARVLITASSRWSLMRLRPNAKKRRDRLKKLAGKRKRKINFSNSRKLRDSD